MNAEPSNIDHISNLQRDGHGDHPVLDNDRPTVHELKSHPPYYGMVANGVKRFEVRRNDRRFREDDVIHLREWDPSTEEYSGRSLFTYIRYILGGGQYGVQEGYVVLGLDDSNSWGTTIDYFEMCYKHPDPCRVCGCTNAKACPSGCMWVEKDLCSACTDKT